MKRFRDIFHCPRSFRLRCFRPRCLCAGDNVSRCQSVEEVYQRSDAVAESSQIDIDSESPVAQSDLKLELETPVEPSGASFQDDLSEPCDIMKTQEDLNVPEEPGFRLETEALPEPPEASSLSDLPEPEQEPHVPIEQEVKAEIKALPHSLEAELEVESLPNVPKVTSLSDLPELQQEPHVPTKLEVKTEIEALPHPPETELEVEALPDPPEVAFHSDFPEPKQEPHVPTDLEVETKIEALPQPPEAEHEIEALNDPPEASSLSDLPEPEQEPHVPTELEVKTENEALPHPPEAELEVETLPDPPEMASLSDLPELQQEPHVPTELEVKTEIEALPHPPETELEVDPPEVAFDSDFPEPEQEPHVPTDLEVETQIEALPHPPEAELEIEALNDPPEVISHSDLREPEQEPHVPTELEVETENEALPHPPEAELEVEALPDPPEVASHSDLPRPEQEPHVPTEPEVEIEIKALPHPPEAELENEALLVVPELTSLSVLSELDSHVPTEQEVKTEIEALPHPPEAASLIDCTKPEQLHVPSEQKIKLEMESHPDPPEGISLGDHAEIPEDVIIQEEPVQDPEPAVETPCEPDVKVPDEEEDIPQASADERIQRQFPVSLQDFRCCAVLGEGAFGKVLLAEYIQTQSMFAIKAIKKADVIKRKFAKNLRNEKEIFQTISSAHHPFLVNLFASFQDEHYIFFVMEYAAGGDLMSNMAKIADSFPEDRVVFYTACVVLGIECLHQNKIIHRDLKLENIVLDKEGYAKITDFGLSKAGIGFGDQTKSFAGTPDYMAPEMVAKQPYTRDVDWWSLGVLIYSMLTAQMPFDEEERDKLYHQIINSEVSYPQDWCPESTSLVSQLLVKDPSQRLGSGEKGAEDVKAHPFFRDMEWTRLLLRELRPPFQPPLSGPEDVSNFDDEFTSMPPVLTSPRGPGLTEEQQDVFKDFEWTAEWAL